MRCEIVCCVKNSIYTQNVKTFQIGHERNAQNLTLQTSKLYEQFYLNLIQNLTLRLKRENPKRLCKKIKKSPKIFP